MNGAAEPPALPPEGWYPDPDRPDGERYWDGAHWSDEYRTPQTGHRLEDPSDRPQSLEILSRLAIAGLVVCALVEVNNIAADLEYMGLITDVIEGDPATGLETAEVQDRVDAASIAVGVSYLVTGLLFFIPWFHRAYANLSRMGVKALRYKPVWAIGSWFIPIFNLFRPKQIANDIWRASAADAHVGDERWHARAVGALVHWWWALFLLAGLVVGVGANVIAHADDQPVTPEAQLIETLELERTGYTLDVVGSVISIAAAVLAIVVVRRLTATQAETIAGLERESALSGTSAPFEPGGP